MHLFIHLFPWPFLHKTHMQRTDGISFCVSWKVWLKAGVSKFQTCFKCIAGAWKVCSWGKDDYIFNKVKFHFCIFLCVWKALLSNCAIVFKRHIMSQNHKTMTHILFLPQIKCAFSFGGGGGCIDPPNATFSFWRNPFHLDSHDPNSNETGYFILNPNHFMLN